MVLALRTRLLLVLVLIGLAPLLLAVAINLPLVLERVGMFYQHAFLQDLRADFRDLDQHLASRYETVRLLAKLRKPRSARVPTEVPRRNRRSLKAPLPSAIHPVAQDSADCRSALESRRSR